MLSWGEVPFQFRLSGSIAVHFTRPGLGPARGALQRVASGSEPSVEEVVDLFADCERYARHHLTLILL